MKTKDEILNNASLDYNTKAILEILCDIRTLLSRKIELPDKPTELEIYFFIQANNIPLKYNPKRDKKEDILAKLKEKGYL